jgi:hypothetical protein
LELRVVKENTQELDYETTHTKLAKEELQELDHQQSNPNIIKEERETKIQRWMPRG